MFDPYVLLGPVLRRLDPERAHDLAMRALANGLVPAPTVEHDPILSTRVWGINFPNPVGLAAGFDKNAVAIDAFVALGFGFVEVGTVTPLPQPGNPKPRLFRLREDQAIINRFGFNNEGLDAVRERLERRRDRGLEGVFGCNVGKNKTSTDAIADYVRGITSLGPLADYLVINVSSPNTPGLRGLQRREPLLELLRAAVAARNGLARKPPLLLKVAPDLTEDERGVIAEVVVSEAIDGLVVSNTTVARPASLVNSARSEEGGLSGLPLFGPSTAVLSDLYALTGGRLPIIGVGGVGSGEQAYAKIRAGASLVQLYTALVYGGPGLVRRILRDLASRLRADGFTSVAQAVGADHRPRSTE